LRAGGATKASVGVTTKSSPAIASAARSRYSSRRRSALAISHVAVTREREVVVVDVEDRPGVLADLTRKIARAGVNLDLVYVATQNRVVFGAPDLAALRAALDAAS
jgi:hypothetical protein